MYESSTPSDCPFCLQNNLLSVPILAETDGTFLIDNITFPGNYLIIPKAHAEDPGALPDTWWRDVKAMLSSIPSTPESYNLSFNIGRDAGQTVRHLHLWVVPRAAGEPASQKGLVTLINFRNEHA